MSKVITLPSGNTATLRDPSTLKVKDRKKVFAAANDQEGILQALSIADGLIAVLVEAWSFDAPIPSIMLSTLDELSMADYDVLTEHAAQAQDVLFPNLGKTPETEADPKAVTENFSA